MPLTKQQLDEVAAHGCQMPGCNHEHDAHKGLVYLHGRCHLRGRVEASYQFGTGILHIACAECKKTIADVMVQGILGATGEVPTSETPGDLGGLNAALSVQDGRIRVDFGKSVSWVTMTAEEAELLASVLFEKAMELKKEA